MRHQAARDGTAQYGVAVIQRGIGPAFIVALEMPVEQLREVIRGGLTFLPVGVSGSDPARVGFQLPLLNSEWVTRSRTDRSLRVYVHAKQTV
jgi:hypothetical protein